MSTCSNVDKTKAHPPRRRPRLLLGVTGSVAAVKAPELAVRFSKDYHMDVCVLLTRGGRNFWDKANEYDEMVWDQVQQRIVESSSNGKPNNKMAGETTTNSVAEDQNGNGDGDQGTIQLYDADDEWRLWNRMGDPVLHVELRDWADALVIAPLSAHSLAKLAHGLCDDTLSCVVRAWDFGHGNRPAKPMVLVPAMNTAMWEHPLTRSQLETIQGFAKKTDTGNHRQDEYKEGGGVTVVSPQVKTLACGEVGNGAMAAADDILKRVHDAMQSV